MTLKRSSIHGEWSSPLIFVLAATGSAVGLGNIWKFPYITGENGGGAFVLVYLACIAIIGIPIMMAEILLGRTGRSSPINTMRELAEESGASKVWGTLGWLGVVAGFLIMAFYSVVAGWAIAYVLDGITGTFTGITGEASGAYFKALITNPGEMAFWHSLFCLMTVLVVARGVRSGLERAVQVLMPLLFVLLIVLLVYAANTGQFGRAVEFLFTPDFSKLTGKAVLTALGHAFFTLSLGMGAIMAYGSYLPERASIGKAALLIAGADTVIALLAGLVIFPIVFANGLSPSEGPGLVFVSLPVAFGQMPGGVFFGALFFLLLTFAAWTSAISLIEPATEHMVENFNMSRGVAASVIGGLAWALGLLVVLSFSGTFLSFEFTFAGATKDGGLLDALDILTSTFMLPLGGLAIALFVGWILKRQLIHDHLLLHNEVLFAVWIWLVRVVSPVAVVLLFLNALGLL